METQTATAAIEPPAATDSELALVDLSSIAYPLWHISQSEPDPNATSTKIVERVRALTSQHKHAAICCDSGRSFRHDIDPNYKAQRPVADAALKHQIALAKERLAADGYPVWCVKGCEADDLIASATARALAIPETTVLIISGDKDLLQLVGPRVRAKSVQTGVILDTEAVVAKFGVTPEQMADFLTLVGDSSDNIKGADGIGPKKAAELLGRWGSLDGVYAALTQHGTQFKPAMATALRAFQSRMADTRKLVALKSDVEIPFEEIAAERTPADAAPLEDMDMAERQEIIDAAPSAAAVVVEAAPVAAPATDAPKPANGNGSGHAPVREGEGLAPAPAEFERQLEPRSLGQAMSLASHMHAARMFNGYGSPQAVLSTILAGRELGLQAIASLRGFHVIEGKHALAADAMRALVLRSGAAKFFRVIERTPQRATFETWRVNDPEPVRLTYTVEEGYAAFRPELPEADRKKKWDASAWAKHPSDMLAARASSKLARLVYSDILFGLYAPEELRD